MKFLADMGVSLHTIRELRSKGHDAVHLVEEGLVRLTDDKILAKARTEERIVLTFDLDFGDLLAVGCESLPSVVIFRLRDATPSNVTAKLEDIVNLRTDQLQGGAVIIVEDFRHRIRHLPIES